MRKDLNIEIAKEYLEKLKVPYKWVYVDENGNEIDTPNEVYYISDCEEELKKYIKEHEK